MPTAILTQQHLNAASPTKVPESLFSGVKTKIVNYLTSKLLTTFNLQQACLYLLDRWEPYAIATQNNIDNTCIKLLRGSLLNNWDQWFEIFAEVLGLKALPEASTENTVIVYNPLEELVTEDCPLVELNIPEKQQTAVVALMLQTLNAALQQIHDRATQNEN